LISRPNHMLVPGAESVFRVSLASYLQRTRELRAAMFPAALELAEEIGFGIRDGMKVRRESKQRRANQERPNEQRQP